MLFPSFIQVHIDEPSDNEMVINGLHVSGWCNSARTPLSVTVSFNKGELIRGIVGTYRPDLKSSFLKKRTGFSIFFPHVHEKIEMELNFEFKGGSREIYRKEFKLNVQKMMDREDYPYQLVLHNAGVEGRVLKRENIYGFGPPAENPTPEVLDMILHYAGKKVLDVGCGIGVYVDALAKENKEAKGIEVNEDHVRRGQKLNRDVMHYDGRII